MITFTQLVSRAADIIGVNTSTDSQDLSNIQYDINQGLRLFKNGARRYWTRKEVTTSLVAGQQYYTFPEDMVRITAIKCNTGSGTYNFPLKEIDSEVVWNKLNIVTNNTIIVPQFYFVRGRNEVGLYPTPSINVSAGLIVSYEPRMTDMSVADTTTTTVTVANGSQFVTSPSTSFNTNMVGQMFSVTDGSDGNWYPIIAATSSQLTLENYYQGTSESGATCIIGLVPDIPEEYQIALIYYTAWQYYLKRNEQANSQMYNALFQQLLDSYIEVYAAKSTGLVQTPIDSDIFNVFYINPTNLSG